MSCVEKCLLPVTVKLEYVLLSESSVRSKLVRLRATYRSISKAEEAFGLSAEAYAGSSENVGEPLLKASSSFSNLDILKDSQIMDLACKAARKLPNLLRKELLKEVFHALLDSEPETAQSVSDEFAKEMAVVHGFKYSDSRPVTRHINAMRTLSAAGKNPYLVEKFATCITDRRPNSMESLMPLDKMPFGLIQFQIDFFTASNVNDVSFKGHPCLQLIQANNEQSEWVFKFQLCACKNWLGGYGWSSKTHLSTYRNLGQLVVSSH